MSDRISHKFDSGKYTVTFEGGKLWAERHGEMWQGLNGDGLVLSMLQEVDDLKAAVTTLNDRVHALKKIDTQSQIAINDLREVLTDLLQENYGLMPDVASMIRKALGLEESDIEKRFNQFRDDLFDGKVAPSDVLILWNKAYRP
ncbi:hypothetical protein uan_115 [Pseudomonas phage UAntarctica]|nr:hypothetical protein uan_115 [Pseudomonas phage UAntarctica]